MRRQILGESKVGIMGKKKAEREYPRGRANDTIEDLDKDCMLGSEGWKKLPKKKKSGKT